MTHVFNASVEATGERRLSLSKISQLVVDSYGNRSAPNISCWFDNWFDKIRHLKSKVTGRLISNYSSH